MITVTPSGRDVMVRLERGEGPGQGRWQTTHKLSNDGLIRLGDDGWELTAAGRRFLMMSDARRVHSVAALPRRVAHAVHALLTAGAGGQPAPPVDADGARPRAARRAGGPVPGGHLGRMSDDDNIEPPELGTLTVLWGDAEGDAPVRTRRLEMGSHCLHKSVELDHDAHRVFCRACKREVDAFDFLAGLAREWERYESWVRSHKRAARHAEDELDNIRRQLRNGKAQLRRLTKRVPPVAPNSVEDVVLRWLAAWRSSGHMSAFEIGRHVRWMLTATPRDQEEPGDWRTLGRAELAAEREGEPVREATVHELRPERS